MTRREYQRAAGSARTTLRRLGVACLLALVCSSCRRGLPPIPAQRAEWPADERLLPNLPLPTLGGMQFWTDRRVRRGWRLQTNDVTHHWRLLDPNDTRRAWGSADAMLVAWDRLAAPEIERIEAEERPADLVVVAIHGMAQTKASWNANLADLRAYGDWRGLRVEAVAINYASTRLTMEEAAQALDDVLKGFPPETPVAFVCHSQGGIVANTWLAFHRGRRAGEEPRKVACLAYLGTPFQSSPILDLVRDYALYRAIMGPGSADLPVSLRRLEEIDFWPDCPTLCAAGSRPPDGFNNLIPGDDDGLVAVESALSAKATRQMTLPVGHTGLPLDPTLRAALADWILATAFPRARPSPAVAPRPSNLAAR